MSLPTTNFPATLPCTASTTGTNCAASTNCAISTASNPLPASAQLLPGDAARFAQSILPGQKNQVETAGPQGPAFPAISTTPESGKPAGDMTRADNTDRAGSTAKTGKHDSRGDAILDALTGALDSTLGGVTVPTADASPSMGSVDPAGQTRSSGLAKISGMKQRVLTQLVDSILVPAQEGKQEVPLPVQDAARKDTTQGARMGQSTTEFLAALPSTGSTDSTNSMNSTASTDNTDNTASAAAPASASGRLLPGHATDFAQAILPGQPTKADIAGPQGSTFPPIFTGTEGGKLAGDMMKTDKADRADKAGSTANTGKPDSKGDAILSALGGVATPTADASPSMGSVDPVGQTNSAGLAEISGIHQRVLTQLVDSILVSAQEGKQEVHIKVQDAVLKDTTIVVRMQDGHLEVQLHTRDNYSSQLLYQNVDALRHALEGHQFGETVRVKVEDRAAGQHADGQGAGSDADRGQWGQGEQQNQRSRGNFLWDRDEG